MGDERPTRFRDSYTWAGRELTGAKKWTAIILVHLAMGLVLSFLALLILAGWIRWTSVALHYWWSIACSWCRSRRCT